MTETTELAGRTALVTGAGRGIGAAIAHALARAGAAVVVTARSTTEIESLAERIRDDGGDAVAIRCDVGDEASVDALRDEVRARGRHVDILVNNAGIAESAPLARTPLELWERLLRTNATGTFLCTRAFAPEMVGAGWGRIVNVASTAGLVGGRYIGAYAASKHAVLGLTRSLALELAANGVTVNAVCPGYVNTGMTDASMSAIQERTGRDREQALAAVLARMPQQRLIEPEEVAHSVLSLCAARAGGINGQAIVLDGGESAG